MPLLLLDPLVLLLAAGIATYGVVVWLGGFRAWFGRERLWWWCWPLPALLLAVPLLVGPLERALIGLVADDGGGLAGVAAYLVVNAVPIAWLSLAPPRWLLPPWARARLAAPPSASQEAPVPGAVPAVHAWGPRGSHGSPRWRWRVDGVPGHVWTEPGGRLRFRALPGHDELAELDQSEVDQLDLHLGESASLRPPRGGWWTRRLLDVELDEVDRCRVRSRRPWDGAGLLALEVADRPTVHLWLAEVEAVRTGRHDGVVPGER